MRLYIPFIVGAILAAAVQGSADYQGDYPILARDQTICKPSTTSGCASCGADWAACGTDACYSPKAGEICCSNRYSCPATANCSSTGIGCIPRTGKRREGDCPEDGSKSSSVPSTSSTAGISNTSGTSASTTDSGSASSSSASTSSNTTSLTTTITSTTTSTVTISEMSSGACAVTTGLPLTTSMAPFGNSSTSTVALNTTTSTLSVTNVSSTYPASISPFNVNASEPTTSIVPPISGYKGGAIGLQAQSSTSFFAFGSLAFMAALLI